MFGLGIWLVVVDPDGSAELYAVDEFGIQYLRSYATHVSKNRLMQEIILAGEEGET